MNQAAHIFKYKLPITDDVIELDLPNYNAYCDIQARDDDIYLWCMVDIHEVLIKKRFKIFGTGHKIDSWDNYHYLKTVQMPNGLVWHVFECMN